MLTMDYMHRIWTLDRHADILAMIASFGEAQLIGWVKLTL